MSHRSWPWWWGELEWITDILLTDASHVCFHNHHRHRDDDDEDHAGRAIFPLSRPSRCLDRSHRCQWDHQHHHYGDENKNTFKITKQKSSCSFCAFLHFYCFPLPACRAACVDQPNCANFTFHQNHRESPCVLFRSILWWWWCWWWWWWWWWCDPEESWYQRYCEDTHPCSGCFSGPPRREGVCFREQVWDLIILLVMINMI